MAADQNGKHKASVKNLKYMWPVWIGLAMAVVTAIGTGFHRYHVETRQREEADWLAQAAMSSRGFGVTLAERLYRSGQIEVDPFRDIVVAALRAGEREPGVADEANDSILRVLEVGDTRASRLKTVLSSIPPQLTVFTSQAASERTAAKLKVGPATLDGAIVRHYSKDDIAADLMVCSTQALCDELGDRLLKVVSGVDGFKVEKKIGSTTSEPAPSLRRIDLYLASVRQVAVGPPRGGRVAKAAKQRRRGRRA